jgi:integrase
MSATVKDHKRGERGKGRLYIRLKGGKQLKAGTSHHNGCYCLEYWQPTGKQDAQGKPTRKKKRVKLLDESGSEITTLVKAEQARDKELRLNVAASRSERLAQIKAELEAADTVKEQALDTANPPLKIADAWDEFKDHPNLDCGDTLLYNYASHWRQFKEWLGSHDKDAVFMRDVTKQTAQDYARHLNKRKISPNTYNKNINFLRLIFNVLKDEIRAEQSPFVELTTKKLNSAKKKAATRQKQRRELSVHELIDVLDKADGDLQILFMIGAYTGLRLGDCCTLKWNEVDLERGLIKRIPNKTQGEPILIGIPVRLVARLSGTPRAQRKGYVLPKYAEDYTYVSEKGKHSHRTRITNRIQKHFEMNCGISTHAEGTGYNLISDPENEGKFIRQYSGRRAVVEVGFHSLRHTFVSLQAEQGTSGLLVQQIVGHGNPAMTQHYHHISPEAAKSATLNIGDGVQDAEFEEVRIVPPWIREKLETVNFENWEQVISEVLNGDHLCEIGGQGGE